MKKRASNPFIRGGGFVDEVGIPAALFTLAAFPLIFLVVGG